MKAVIMAGGKGTRLQSITKDIPKPMFPVLGKPILEYQMESLKKSGITEIVLIIGYLGDVVRNYFADGQHLGISIEYIIEETPLGTAGALYYLKDKVSEDFLLIFGDLMLDIDWSRFMRFHKQHSALVTLYAHPNSHPHDSDVIVTDEKDKVLRIESKNADRDFYYRNLINAGLYCISPELLKDIPAPEKIDLEKDLIAGQIMKDTVYAYRSTEYVKDMGTPDRLRAVSEDIRNNLMADRSLKNRQRAVFLDRDGTINVLKGFLHRTDELELLPGAAGAIKKINASRYLAIVATNQPVIARGECTLEELKNIHKKLETDLGGQGAYLDDLFFCPHHPHKGYAGEIPVLKFECECRKPKTGMLIQAAQKYNIDLACSWYIGDTTTDIQTGINAGLKTVLVLTGEAGTDGKYEVIPDYTAEDLSEAVDYILSYTDSQPCM